MLRVAAAWADEAVSYKYIKDVLGWEPGNAIATAQLCLAADKLGFDATLYSANTDFEQDMYEEDEYYQEHGDMQGAKSALKELER